MRSVTAVSASLLACLAVAPPAFGAEVNAKDPSRWVRVTANDGEVNRLTLSRADNAVTVSDAGADVLAGDGCDQVGPSEVRCVIDGEPRVDVSLGDGDDEATALGALQVKLDGESGNDALNGGDADDKLDGGDGDDTLAGGAGSDGYDGGEGNDTVRARDSVRESVLCGGGEDGGDADVEDELAPDCEGVAKPIAPPSLVEPAPGAPPAPEPGSSVAVAVKTGTVLARIPGASGFAPLDPTRPAPVGTVFDTRNGTLTLTAAKDQVGGTQTADFRGGKFAVAQAPGATMTTDLRMRGGSFAGCPSVTARASVARAAASRRRVVRKLWGSGKGRFRTRGRHSSATVRGTTWEVVDRCDGTLTRVRSGIVVVANNRTGRTKVVKAGESFFVRRRARR